MKRKEFQPWRRPAPLERLEVRRLLAAIVADASFESPAEPANSYVYDPTGSVWTFSSTCGIVNPPSSLGAPAAPDGTQVAFLQTNRSASEYNGSDGSISQSITLPSAGYYNLSVEAAADANDVGGAVAAEESFMVALDGAPLLTGLHPTSSAFSSIGGTFYASAGTHVLALESTGPDSTTTFLDEVQLTPVTPGAAAQIAITAVPQSLATGVMSSPITVQLEDSSGLAVNAGVGGVVVSLGSTSNQGLFFNASNVLTSAVTIPAGSSTTTFKYKDGLAGNPTITASATGLTAAGQTESVQKVTSSSFLRTSGTSIVNGSGQTVQLRGVNLGSWLVMEGWMSPMESSGLPDEYGVIQALDNRFGVAEEQSLVKTYQQNWITLQDLENIKAQGFNVIRVPVWWGDFETLQGQWRSDAFGELDWLVNTAGSMGIYTIIDMHGVVGGQSTSDDTGQANVNDYWTSSYDQRQTDVLIENIAQHYKNNPMVAGYDLMNEPDNAPSDSAVIAAYGQLYSALRSVDTNHIAIIEGTFDQRDWSMLPSPASEGWTDVMYEMHEYQWSDTNNAAGVEAGTNNQVSDFQNHASYGVPDYVGEFNDFGTGSSTWQYTMVQFDNNNINWSFWSYKATNGTASSENSWGLYDPVSSLTAPNIQNATTATIASDWSNVTTAGAFAINPMLQWAITGAGVNAGVAVWSGNDSNNWYDPGNWSTSSVPNSSTNVIINSGDPTAFTAFDIASLTITGGELRLASGSGSSVVNSLSINGSGFIDVTNNKLFIDFGSAIDPIATIAGYLHTGYNGGNWSGLGIDSSAAAANGSYSVGYSDGADGVVAGLSSGQIEVAYTLLGDANLDGNVNGEDFTILAANFNQSVTGWDQGDFNYDGTVNGEDFTVLAANFNQSATLAAVSVPVTTFSYAAPTSLSSPVSALNATQETSTSASSRVSRRAGRPGWGVRGQIDVRPPPQPSP
jgi:aryl-phospho-beta-D-glucosidase BglC (GH1 family)